MLAFSTNKKIITSIDQFIFVSPQWDSPLWKFEHLICLPCVITVFDCLIMATVFYWPDKQESCYSFSSDRCFWCSISNCRNYLLFESAGCIVHVDCTYSYVYRCVYVCMWIYYCFKCLMQVKICQTLILEVM